MKGKSVLFSILTTIVAILTAYKGLFSEHTQAWIGVAAFCISTVLATFYSSGTIVTGWTTSMIVVSVAGTIVQVLNAIADAALVPPVLVTSIVLGINIFINVFYKTYPPIEQAGGTSSITENRTI